MLAALQVLASYRLVVRLFVCFIVSISHAVARGTALNFKLPWHYVGSVISLIYARWAHRFTSDAGHLG